MLITSVQVFLGGSRPRPSVGLSFWIMQWFVNKMCHHWLRQWFVHLLTPCHYLNRQVLSRAVYMRGADMYHIEYSMPFIWKINSWRLDDNHQWTGLSLVQVMACCSRHLAISWTGIDFVSRRFCSIHPRIVAQEMLLISITKMSWENYTFKITVASPRANDLTLSHSAFHRCSFFYRSLTNCGLLIPLAPFTNTV